MPEIEQRAPGNSTATWSILAGTTTPPSFTVPLNSTLTEPAEKEAPHE